MYLICRVYIIGVHFLFSRECSWPSRVAYVRFEDSRDAQIALHLMNTVFIDRAIMITIVDDGIAFNFYSLELVTFVEQESRYLLMPESRPLPPV